MLAAQHRLHQLERLLVDPTVLIQPLCPAKVATQSPDRMSQSLARALCLLSENIGKPCLTIWAKFSHFLPGAIPRLGAMNHASR